eukprot:3237565-Rhodomonas_salina.2
MVTPLPVPVPSPGVRRSAREGTVWVTRSRSPTDFPSPWQTQAGMPYYGTATTGERGPPPRGSPPAAGVRRRLGIHWHQQVTVAAVPDCDSDTQPESTVRPAARLARPRPSQARSKSQRQ